MTHGEKLKLLIQLLNDGAPVQVSDASDAQSYIESAQSIVDAVAEFIKRTEPKATATIRHFEEVSAELGLTICAIEDGEL